MLMSYLYNIFSDGCLPTLYDILSKNVTVEDREINLLLCDTSGQDDLVRIREFLYQGGVGVVIICFDLCRRPSLKNVKCTWYPEVSKFLPGVPIVLVGMKLDLRESMNMITEERWKIGSGPVTTVEGMALAKEIKASDYFECSARTSVGLNEVFYQAIHAVLHPPTKESSNKSCSIM